MTLAPRRSPLALVLALALSSLALSSAARAEEPRTELRIPAAPDEGLATQLAAMKQSLPADLHAAFAVVVADAHVRLRASERAAAAGEGKRLGIDEACRAALHAADFAGISKRKPREVALLVFFTSLQLTFDLHAALRERAGRQLAIRAVRACKGATACLDGIAPTPEMPAALVLAVRTQFEGKTKELDAADRLGNFELQQLLTTYETSVSRVKTSDKMQKAVLDFIKG